uniref:B box-type domain-containing protein n=1 Tax=Sphenodon punctatus TaxID=8508 RepID=A0A8D0H8W6_SPHPU
MRSQEVKEPRGGSMCVEHEEALKLFCKVDQIPICLICRESWVHKAHAVAPIAEAAKDYKDQILNHLESLKKERKEILEWQLRGEKESQGLLKETNTERRKTVAEFKQLHQFLEEQEQLLLTRLEVLDKEIVKRRDAYTAKLSEEISALGHLIRELEGKCQQPMNEFLQVWFGHEKHPEQVFISHYSGWEWALVQRMAWGPSTPVCRGIWALPAHGILLYLHPCHCSS